MDVGLCVFALAVCDARSIGLPKLLCLCALYYISSQTGMEQLERVTDHLLVDLLHKQKEKKKEKAEKLDHFALNRFGEAAEDVESVVITPSAESDEAQK